jgi:3-phosphoshikimate 1-carboxyvinyltransferase
MRITGVNKNFDVEVDLVGSKSESNRALMIGYYGGFTPRVKNLSTSDDTVLLNEIIQSLQEKTRFIASHNPTIIDCHNAGTVLRFLLTALAFREGEWILTGSDRMLQRPVGDLVDALRTMGAKIDYVGNDGFPPLKITGKPLKINDISVDVTRSSQFASSLLLAKPSHLHLDGDLSSLPYIDMTIDIMCHFSAHVRREGRDIFVQPSDYQDVEYTVESDWTCASYWYEIVAFSENGRARLRNLHLDSKQGDAIVAKWFEQFGVQSIQDGNDVVISNVGTRRATSELPKLVDFDFLNNPDLYPTIAATCAGLNVEGRFTGLRNLKHKESDRVAAMAAELARVKTFLETSRPIVFDSHNDHRIAMALAPLAMKIGAIEIDNADVVSKSYPNFWEEFQKITPSL